ncbi:putative glycine dehydrogenase (decarboxylating) subunit 1 [Marinicauda pacifica]|uniref:Probable glycine dehydrogenase (decarboxylating) subunit 1 n=1 Tax=Marinicauda pacifica TaxID=1133559 RepID=A0A4S2HFF7_9PROT|nr:aminomethyl-transferring glycine dehydrogenase subunit GcvPA [Marinicauda pacifica]TGY94847.1 aminomethyl-transferring glycine dehydrogenase subunit GcvPA [Marinicauda pacifica]GGE39330.1 putative glycine dehydrogenase (decarboxylating) subunit 1 [Marinicauda pacifica]
MRYLPLTPDDRTQMLETIGVSSIDALFTDVPESARLDGPVDLPRKATELEVERAFAKMARKNLSAGEAPFFVGAGAYKHHVPATVDHLIQRSEFLTAYTPYQPEISQGTLQTLFEFQTQVARLTGMAVANASMYDGSTACAEAVLMASRVTKRKKAVLSGNLHPHYSAATATLAKYMDIEVETEGAAPGRADDLVKYIDDDTACIVVQNPDVFGHVRDLTALAEAAHAKGALLIAVVTEIVSLGLMTSPGEMGADIVVGEGQSLGVGLQFGGPYVGLFACRDDRNFIRNMPGRLAGETVDADGRRGFVLTLSTREQHIRRDKATSNICTNSGLMALAWTIHMSLLGEKGLTQLARLNHERAIELADRLAGIKGVELVTDAFFNEFTVKLTRPATEVVEALAQRGILAGVPASRLYPGQFETHLILAATETNTDGDLDALEAALKEVL